MSFIKIPNMPKKDVTDVIAGCDIDEKSIDTLSRFGIRVHNTKPCDVLYNAVRCHADMVFHHIGENNVIVDPSQKAIFEKELPALNICSGKKVMSDYPYDILYNAARVGNYLICNRRFTDSNILNYAEKDNLEIIDAKQGYAKCNICPITENAVITSDIGIKSALGNFPVECLLIDDTSVLLKDFNHGFFGGASGKIAPDKLAVNGNIKYHKNADEIIKFAKKYSIEVISLNDGYIEDIGSIMPILEK